MKLSVAKNIVEECFNRKHLQSKIVNDAWDVVKKELSDNLKKSPTTSVQKLQNAN